MLLLTFCQQTERKKSFWNADYLRASNHRGACKCVQTTKSGKTPILKALTGNISWLFFREPLWDSWFDPKEVTLSAASTILSLHKHILHNNHVTSIMHASAISEDIREEQAAFQVQSCIGQFFALKINHRAMPRAAKMIHAVNFNDFQQALIASTMTVPGRLWITGYFYRIDAIGNCINSEVKSGDSQGYTVCLYSIRRADRLTMDLCQHSQTLQTWFSTSDRTSVH